MFSLVLSFPAALYSVLSKSEFNDNRLRQEVKARMQYVKKNLEKWLYKGEEVAYTFKRLKRVGGVVKVSPVPPESRFLFRTSPSGYPASGAEQRLSRGAAAQQHTSSSPDYITDGLSLRRRAIRGLMGS